MEGWAEVEQNATNCLEKCGRKKLLGIDLPWIWGSQYLHSRPRLKVKGQNSWSSGSTAFKIGMVLWWKPPQGFWNSKLPVWSRTEGKRRSRVCVTMSQKFHHPLCIRAHLSCSEAKLETLLCSEGSTLDLFSVPWAWNGLAVIATNLEKEASRTGSTHWSEQHIVQEKPSHSWKMSTQH